MRTLDTGGFLLTKTDHRDKDLVDRQVLAHVQNLIDVARRTPLLPVQSKAVRRLGYAPGARMVLVVFTDSAGGSRPPPARLRMRSPRRP